MGESIPILSIGKPVVYGGAGLLGIYLLSKYLQNKQQNRILSGIDQLAQSNAAMQKSMIRSQNNEEPKVSNYPEF